MNKDGLFSDSIAERNLNEPEERKRAIYRIFESGDTRFDGRVFVGVTSTGIYCRTVCKAKMPKYENCRFFHTPAEAEAAGFRPCMTCRPEVAPGMSLVDANSNLAKRAAIMLRDSCTDSMGIEKVASKLGYTGRHLRRAFLSEYGTTPSQYVTSCRLLLAKSLLTDSNLPVSHVAKASGFGSVRRFNDAFKKHYHLTPSDLRKKRGESASAKESIVVRLGYRPPYRFDELLAFFRDRALAGVEVVDQVSYARTVRLSKSDGSVFEGWIRVQNESTKHRLALEISESLVPVIPDVIGRVRRMFDTDSDPETISRDIASLKSVAANVEIDGVRLPGCFDPFETACRAVLGQQVSVKAANKIASRISQTFGAHVETGIEGLDSAWPSPSEVVGLASIEDAFGKLGVVRTRSRVIREVAQMLLEGELNLGVGTIADEQISRLLQVKGIGPWTANYIAMRTLSYPDAFLETDAGIAHALPDMTPQARLAAAEPCRPWRSYAVITLWNSLSE